MESMSYKEAAQFLKITEGTLRNWVSKDRIKPHKIGKRILFFREELEVWITTHPSPIPNPPVASAKQAPVAPKPQAGPVEWDARFQLSFSERSARESFAHLETLPGEAVKMTPANMRELARYLVEAARMCEDPAYRGVKHFRLLRESSQNLSAACLIPHDLMRDLKTLSQAAARSGDPQTASPEKYIARFIIEGLRAQLPGINKRLRERGARAVNFISVR